MIIFLSLVFSTIILARYSSPWLCENSFQIVIKFSLEGSIPLLVAVILKASLIGKLGIDNFFDR
jgi:hypothetical protein